MAGLKELKCVGSTALLSALAYTSRCARSLGKNDLGPEGAVALAPALEKMVGLKELKCVSSTALLSAFAHTCPRCARSLEKNYLGPDGARALAPALEKMVGLKELSCVTPFRISPKPFASQPVNLF